VGLFVAAGSDVGVDDAPAPLKVVEGEADVVAETDLPVPPELRGLKDSNRVGFGVCVGIGASVGSGASVASGEGKLVESSGGNELRTPEVNKLLDGVAEEAIAADAETEFEGFTEVLEIAGVELGNAELVALAEDTTVGVAFGVGEKLGTPTNTTSK